MARPRPLSNRSRRGLAAFASTALITTTVYCGGSAFQAAPADTSGPDGEALDGARADGADTSTGDAPIGDTSMVDAAPSDGAVEDTSTGDASVVDAAPPDAGAVSCSSPPSGTLFCADFDHVLSPDQTWSQPALTYGGGINAFDTVTFISPPNGYATSIPKTATAAFACLTNSAITSGATRIDFGFAANVKQIDMVDDATITAARLAVGSNGGRDLYLDLLLDKKGLRLEQRTTTSDGGQVTQDSNVVNTLALGTWVRIRLELDRGLMPAVRVFVDDVKKLEVTPITTKITGLGIDVELGMIFVQSPSTAAAITYDDVLVRGLL